MRETALTRTHDIRGANAENLMSLKKLKLGRRNMKEGAAYPFLSSVSRERKVLAHKGLSFLTSMLRGGGDKRGRS